MLLTCLHPDWNRTLSELTTALQHRRVLEQRRRHVGAVSARLRNLDSALETFIHNQPPRDDNIWPRALDLFDLDVVKHFVELDSLILVPIASYEHMIPRFEALWRKTRQETLLALLPGVGSRPSIPSTRSTVVTRAMATQPSPLSLLQAIFWCVRCEELVTGPQAMQHRCCYAFVHDWETINPHTAPYLDGAYSPLVMEGVNMLAKACMVNACGLQPWSAECLVPCLERLLWDTVPRVPAWTHECGVDER